MSSSNLFDFDMKWENDSDRKVLIELKQIPQNIPAFQNRALVLLGNRLQQLIEQKAPKKTGKYAKEWYVSEVQGNAIFIKNPDGKLFKILEFTGRRPGRIHGKPILHFQIDGEDVFVHWVDHKGFSPRPHVRTSISQLMREAEKIIQQAVKETIPIFRK